MTEQIEEVPAELIQTRVYELRPNETMRRVLDEACDYRRYCWNQGLALWNEMYKERQALKSSLASDSKKLTEEQKVLLKEKPSLSERRVRNMLVADKKDWQYTQSARILQLAISDLGKAWNNFFDKAQPGWGKPKFRSKREARQGFKSDRSKIKDGILYLERARGSRVPKDQWRGFKLSEKPLSDAATSKKKAVITLLSRIRSRLKMLSCQTKQVKLPRLTSMLVTLITRVAG